MDRALGLITNPKIKRPSEAFKRCPNPECNNAHLKCDFFDVYCSLCGWDSAEAYADAGGLDWWDGYDFSVDNIGSALSLNY